MILENENENFRHDNNSIIFHVLRMSLLIPTILLVHQEQFDLCLVEVQKLK